MNNATTFREIEQHSKSAGLTAYDAGGQKHFAMVDVAAAPKNVSKKTGGIYHVVKLIFNEALVDPLIPEFIKKPIRMVATLLNQLHP